MTVALAVFTVMAVARLVAAPFFITVTVMVLAAADAVMVPAI